MLLITLLSSLVFSTIGLINGVFARNFDDTAIVPTFILTPLTYLGGIFYSIELLPPFWRDISLVNPILYVVNVFRYGMLGNSDINIGWAIFIITLIFIGSFWLTIKLLDKGVGIKT